MRTVYIGTGDFGAAVLKYLAETEHRPALIVSRPDQPSGRGRKLRPPPVARLAQELGIELLQPEKLEQPEVLDQITTVGSDLVCLSDYGALVREPLLSERVILNVHPSLLPRWRGAAPIERALWNGDAETGVSIMRLVEALDAGPICAQQKVPIDPTWNAGTLAAQLAEVGGELLAGVLTEAEQALSWIEQPEQGTTYAEKLTSTDRELPLAELTVAQLRNRVRALAPKPGAFITLQEVERLQLLATDISDTSVPSGEVVRSGDELLLGCQDGAAKATVVKPAGGREMAATDFMRGSRAI